MRGVLIWGGRHGGGGMGGAGHRGVLDWQRNPYTQLTYTDALFYPPAAEIAKRRVRRSSRKGLGTVARPEVAPTRSAS